MEVRPPVSAPPAPIVTASSTSAESQPLAVAHLRIAYISANKKQVTQPLPRPWFWASPQPPGCDPELTGLAGPPSLCVSLISKNTGESLDRIAVLFGT